MFTVGFEQNEKDTKSTEIKLTKNVRHDASNKNIISLRMVISGPEKSGKTAFIYRFLKDLFNQHVLGLSMDYSGLGAGKASMSLLQADKAINLSIYDLSPNFSKYQQLIAESPNVKDTVVFLVYNIHRENTDLKKDVAERCKNLRAKFENCNIVLVGTKSDKEHKTNSYVLKGVAEECGCIGVAIVSAKKNDQNIIDVLFKRTIQSIIATKESKLTLNVDQLVSLASQVNYPAAAAHVVAPPGPGGLVENVAQRKEHIENINKHLVDLETELLRTFSANKERKLQKIHALKELIWLTEYFPVIPIALHVQTIRDRYRDKELEVGDPSRTKQLLDAITGDQRRPGLPNR